MTISIRFEQVIATGIMKPNCAELFDNTNPRSMQFPYRFPQSPDFRCDKL